MMNNMGILMQAFRNPQAFKEQIINNSSYMQNPISKNAIEMYQKGDKNGLNEMMSNLCKERGINRQEFEKQIRSQFGI